MLAASLTLSLSDCGCSLSLAGHLIKGETLSNDGLKRENESHRVSGLAPVEPECLLIKIAKKVKRFDRYIRALDAALQKRPEVFNPVSVHVAAHVFDRVINHVMDVLSLKLIVGAKRISVDGGAKLDVLINFGVKLAARCVLDYHRADFALAL